MMLGNMKVEEIEDRLGVKFEKEDADFLRETHQSKATDIEENKWHCFYFPFTMVCGSQEFAFKIFKMLSKYNNQVKEPLGIVW